MLEPAVYVELRREAHHTRHFLGSQTLVEAKPHQEPVLGRQRFDRRLERLLQLGLPQLELGTALGGVSERGNIQGAQFFSVAGRVYELAREKGLGKEIPTDWLLQDIRD